MSTNERTKSPSTRRYTEEQKAQAVRLVKQLKGEQVPVGITTVAGSRLRVAQCPSTACTPPIWGSRKPGVPQARSSTRKLKAPSQLAMTASTDLRSRPPSHDASLAWRAVRRLRSQPS